MLHIKVIATGKLKERFWTDACAEYLKRMKPYAQVEVIELLDADPAKTGGEAAAVARESQAALKSVPDNAFAILLDIKGKEVSSEDMAAKLDALAVGGVSEIAFIIGGSSGVDDEVRKRADARWSFGRITLPHNLARVVLLEQLYRAFKINRGEPYHK